MCQSLQCALPLYSQAYTIVYATSEGDVALEPNGIDGTMGFFTKVFCELLGSIGHKEPLGSLLHRVCGEVWSISSQRQKPVVHGIPKDDSFLVDSFARRSFGGHRLAEYVTPLAAAVEQQVSAPML
jgi:hypothetical protein